MATQYLVGQDGAKLPDGIVLAHTLHGEPDNAVTHAHTATAAHGVPLIPVGDDGIEYIGDPAMVPVNDRSKPQQQPRLETRDPLDRERVQDRSKRCIAKGDTCMGWRISGSDLCAAHAGRLPNTRDYANRTAEE